MQVVFVTIRADDTILSVDRKECGRAIVSKKAAKPKHPTPLSCTHFVRGKTKSPVFSPRFTGARAIFDPLVYQGF